MSFDFSANIFVNDQIHALSNNYPHDALTRMTLVKEIIINCLFFVFSLIYLSYRNCILIYDILIEILLLILFKEVLCD